MLRRALLAIFLLHGFGIAISLRAQETPPVLPPATLEQIIADLQNPNDDVRHRAPSRMRELLEKRDLTPDESLRALTAATTLKFPPPDAAWPDSAAVTLISAASKSPTPEGLAILQKEFDRLDSRAKTRALAYFVSLNTPQSIRLFSDLFPKHADKLEDLYPLRDPLEKTLPNETIANVLLTALANEKSTGLAVDGLLQAAQEDRLPRNFLSQNLEPIAAAYRTWLKKLPPAKPSAARSTDERWQDAYTDALRVAEYFPDLLGYTGPAAEGVLRETFAAKDPRLSLFAVGSLFRLGRDVPQAEIDAVADDDEMRNRLYDMLEKLGRKDRFPKAHLNQEAFARSEMVNWLVYPTELGRAPNDIELMKVVDLDSRGKDGVVSFYVFRFRTTGNHWAAKNGWTAGIAGGYRKADAPTTDSLGHTFSAFKSAASLTPEQHLQEITGLLDEWSKHQPPPKPPQK
jgi:hypothetical protein